MNQGYGYEKKYEADKLFLKIGEPPKHYLKKCAIN